MFESLMEEAITQNPETVILRAKDYGLTDKDLKDLKTSLSSLDGQPDLNNILDEIDRLEAMIGEEILPPPVKKVQPTPQATNNRPMTNEEDKWRREMSKKIINATSLEKVHSLEKEFEDVIDTVHGMETFRSYNQLKYRFHRKKVKAEQAKNRFKRLNPDSFNCNEGGMVYFQNSNHCDVRTENVDLFFPLGKKSFADAIVDYHHPEGQPTAKEALGEPDGYRENLWTYHNVHDLGNGGSLTVKFEDNALVDINGPDLYVFGVGFVHPILIEISKDGKEWIGLKEVKGTETGIDIHDFAEPNERYYYVRLTQIENKNQKVAARIDAVGAIGSVMHLNLDAQVLFDTGKSNLKPAGKAALKELAESIKGQKCGLVNIEGHTDDVGSDASNKTLSQKRAASVAAELKKVISSPNFKWSEKGYGETQPLVPNDSDVNRQKNRRVEIVVTPF